MNLFILEDDTNQQFRMEEMIEQILTKHEMRPKQFEIFGQPDQLLQAVSEKGTHQVFFLDIEIKTEEVKGLQVARQIRDIDPFAIIVFVTTHSELMPLSFRYQVSAFDFIDKQLEPQAFAARLEEVLLYAKSKYGKSVAEDSFYFKSKFSQIQYPFDEIYYFETSPRSHRLILYTKTDRLEFTATLSEILKADKRLIQCHRSFAINPQNILRLDRKEKMIYFPNGGSCLVSRRSLDKIIVALEKLHGGDV